MAVYQAYRSAPPITISERQVHDLSIQLNGKRARSRKSCSAKNAGAVILGAGGALGAAIVTYGAGVAYRSTRSNDSPKLLAVVGAMGNGPPVCTAPHPYVASTPDRNSWLNVVGAMGNGPPVSTAGCRPSTQHAVTSGGSSAAVSAEGSSFWSVVGAMGNGPPLSYTAPTSQRNIVLAKQELS
ncbi:hypothetical protein CYMTET_17852 [Cymbomonas tetramitiformis]|uniref:Uncharacterized protein n=1 Tax=Cymbomonas tetramitiformis TaxID=36881 RepID=A0AAE0G9U4_9CHLO|nr:hypothetical protein CYMTET_17852 [Cymbomonas tetramitiformis]